MNEFNDYINKLEKLFSDNGIAFITKDLPYGKQFKLTVSSETVTLSVYHGKQGIKKVWSNKETPLRTKLINLVEGDTDEPLSLLSELPNFDNLWVGSDESGKGDFFGPLVVAAVMLNEESALELKKAGVKDCKAITDKDTLKLAEIIRAKAIYKVLALTPKQYNYRYAQIKAQNKNLNDLLSSGHINAICGALEQNSKCGYALIDKFAANNSIAAQIHRKFPGVKVIQQTKAERDIAVAAASVIARAEFLHIMHNLETEAGISLPKGAGDQTIVAANTIVKKYGMDALERFVKKHFANYAKIDKLL